MLNKVQKEAILKAAKEWFSTIITKNHIENTIKLSKPSAFKINPFLIKYLARYLTGKTDAVSIARALIYPRVLQTSITTSFGTNAQKFISTVLGSFGSAVSGIDIEFVDQLDGRKKYCQVKLGPETINKDDVETIKNHFNSVKNLARTNNLNIQLNDLIVGVMYGEPHELSANYKKIINAHHFPVYVGQEFWYRLTGFEHFYIELSNAISEVALLNDCSSILEETVLKLSQTEEIQNLAKESIFED
ncbi:TPA: PmeII family type II restriction endonuclease [Legionella pneumophila]|uniref:PmeII family type II restriction endonuclease n=1 Tax=Legionella pneumophila TaxID=446 RepID=UPI001A181646|nr:PmeII family type II restriction endonuclease [Legionella pneumophila]HAT9585687.1 restriction endonuclease [Legionella pneumophila subsp. pneumophila]MCH9086382.1 restriction endonuclease [Legionella pneumophila serogroup 1]MCH9197565.1 restriction endonuclease [Legionella pneumophila serogroup 1]MDW9175555.1 PmeII family type II restriction endonuclease [Legionella pneumophila]MDX1856340.1 PmeII family type II restriction endonuclease [Legionella pneumophila]